MHTQSHQGLTVSQIGIGCYGLSGAYGPPDIESTRRTLHRAYELGVTFFDTAHAYGDAERVLGEVVAPYRDEIVLATKIAVPDGLRPSLAHDTVRASCEDSLRRLQTDVIDLYQVHFDDTTTPVADAIATLEALKAEGKIRTYGIGHLPIDRAEQFLAEGTVFSMMMELSAVARTARQTLLPLCARYDAAVLAFSVTGRGLLTGRYRPGTPPRFADGDIRRLDPLFQRERFASGVRVAEQLRAIGARYDRTPAQVAIAWVLAQPQVLVALTGPSQVHHLEENVAAADWTFPEDELAALEAELAAEDVRLAAAETEAVHQIIASPLPGDLEAAFVDLVYAVETAITLGWVEETRVMPVFRELFALSDASDPARQCKLEAVQHELRTLIQS